MGMIAKLLKRLYGTSSRELLKEDWLSFRASLSGCKLLMIGSEVQYQEIKERFPLWGVIEDNPYSCYYKKDGINHVGWQSFDSLPRRKYVVLLVGKMDYDRMVYHIRQWKQVQVYSDYLMDQPKRLFRILRGCFRLVKKVKSVAGWVIKLPYRAGKHLLMKASGFAMWSAFLSYGYQDVGALDRTWRDFYRDSNGKKLVLFYPGEGIHSMFGKSSGKLNIEYVIDWEPKRIGKRTYGIPIKGPDFLDRLAGKAEYIFLITATYRPYVDLACDYLREAGIHSYYSFAQMEVRRLKYRWSYPLFVFWARHLPFFANPRGFMPNYAAFYSEMLLRKLRAPQFRKSMERIEMLKNRHRGERCFIIGTGPSLKICDLEKLSGEITFSVNSIFRLYNRTAWRPTYYHMMDDKGYVWYKNRQYRLNFEDVCEREILLADPVLRVARDDITCMERVVSIPLSYLNHMVYPTGMQFKYRFDIATGMYGLTSCVQNCMNIAHYMGFSEIYLLGVDCNYTLPKTHAGFSGTDMNTLSQHNEVNHYMYEGFAFVSEQMKKAGIQVYNATRGGRLDMYPRVDLDEVLAQKTT